MYTVYDVEIIRNQLDRTKDAKAQSKKRSVGEEKTGVLYYKIVQRWKWNC